MMQHLRPVALCSVVLCCLLATATLSFGSGFGVFTQGAGGLGQANAVTAHVEGPSTIFFNPALLTSLPGTQLEVGTTFIFPEREFTSAFTGQTAKTTDDVFLPSTLYASHRLNDRWAFGLGVFSPFGLATTWPEWWEGRYAATRSSVTSFAVNPSVAWSPAPGISLAAGVDLIYVDAKLNSHLPPPPGELLQQFKGDGTGVSYNLGLAMELGKGFTFGAAYREQYKVELDGDISQGPVAVGANTTLTLPRQLTAGFAYDSGTGLLLEAGVRWEDWSSYKNLWLSVDLPPGAAMVLPRDWRDTIAWNVGGKYRLNETVTLLAGYLYGENPVPDATFEPAVPDSDTHLICVGTDLTFGAVNVALAYGLQLQENRTSLTYPAGSYDNYLHLVGVSIGYRF